jgi:hypothetical protein
MTGSYAACRPATVGLGMAAWALDLERTKGDGAAAVGAAETEAEPDRIEVWRN